MNVEVKQAVPTLFSLVAEAQSLESKIIEAGGELTPDIEEALSSLDIAVTDKVESYAFIMDSCENRAQFWKAKADLYSKIAKSHTLIQERIKERLKAAMMELGKDEVLGHSIRFKLQALKPKLVIKDESKIPADFKVVVQTTAPDKERIASALNDGFEIPGATLEKVFSLRQYAKKEK